MIKIETKKIIEVMTYQHANNFQQNMNSQTNKKNIIQITNPNSNIMTDMVKHKQTGIPF